MNHEYRKGLWTPTFITLPSDSVHANKEGTLFCSLGKKSHLHHQPTDRCLSKAFPSCHGEGGQKTWVALLWKDKTCCSEHETTIGLMIVAKISETMTSCRRMSRFFVPWTRGNMMLSWISPVPPHWAPAMVENTDPEVLCNSRPILGMHLKDKRLTFRRKIPCSLPKHKPYLLQLHFLPSPVFLMYTQRCCCVSFQPFRSIWYTIIYKFKKITCLGVFVYKPLFLALKYASITSWQSNPKQNWWMTWQISCKIKPHPFQCSRIAR